MSRQLSPASNIHRLSLFTALLGFSFSEGNGNPIRFGNERAMLERDQIRTAAVSVELSWNPILKSDGERIILANWQEQLSESSILWLMRTRLFPRLQAALALWRRLPPVSRFRLILGLAGGALAAWVVFAVEKPWTMDLTNRENWKLDQVVSYYSFWAAVANLCILAVLIFTAGWWGAPAPSWLPGRTVV